MKGSKIKEHVCPACNRTDYPVVKQPARQPGRKIFSRGERHHTAVKGDVTDATEDESEAIRRLVEIGLKKSE